MIYSRQIVVFTFIFNVLIPKVIAGNSNQSGFQDIDPLAVQSSITFLDVETDSNGSPVLLTQAAAIAYCIEKGAHLPSALEFTQFATLQGAPPALTAKDIYEKFDGEVPAGYKKITSINSEKVEENFFYNQLGYKMPEDTLKAGFLWTSSNLIEENKDGFIFFGGTGAIVYGKNVQNASAPFLCVKK